MNFRITEWQGKFAMAALVVLEAHFVKAGMAEPEVHATFCRHQLGTNVGAMKAPFLWRTWDDGKKKVRDVLLLNVTCHDCEHRHRDASWGSSFSRHSASSISRSFKRFLKPYVTEKEAPICVRVAPLSLLHLR